MKTLQNNFTTPEQSKRLLKLGVPAAAQALGVSLNVIKRAASKGSLINGHNVEYVNQSYLRSAPKKV